MCTRAWREALDSRVGTVGLAAVGVVVTILATHGVVQVWALALVLGIMRREAFNLLSMLLYHLSNSHLPPSTPDFLGEVDLNLALGLLTICGQSYKHLRS